MNEREILNGLWTFSIELPNNPLKWLNCYVIKGAKKNLLIDTGFNMPECRRDLLAGMAALNISAENTDVLITHMHSDHTGNAGFLSGMGATILMSSIDYDIQCSQAKMETEEKRNQIMMEGISEELLNKFYDNNPASKLSPEPYSAELLYDGDILIYGEYTLRCILSPGHSPGHMCLYDERKQLMFTGDHVLFDITPNITRWTEDGDSLGEYLNSLKIFKRYKVSTALPAHRNIEHNEFQERIDQLLEHHERRLEELRQIIMMHPGQTAYEIAGQMHWSIKASNWSEFPVTQKWFAFLETLAHLDHLTAVKQVKKRLTEGGYVYCL